MLKKLLIAFLVLSAGSTLAADGTINRLDFWNATSTGIIPRGGRDLFLNNLNGVSLAVDANGKIVGTTTSGGVETDPIFMAASTSLPYLANLLGGLDAILGNVQTGTTTVPGTTFDNYTVYPSVSAQTGFSSSYGFTFFVTGPTTVSQLGRYFPAQNTTDHNVVLWQDSPRVVLASTTVLVASGSDARSYKWADITPVTLQAGIRYYLAADEHAPDQFNGTDIYPTFIGGFVKVQGARNDNGQGLAPTALSGMGAIRGTPGMKFAYAQPAGTLTAIAASTAATANVFNVTDSNGKALLSVSNSGSFNALPNFDYLTLNAGTQIQPAVNGTNAFSFANLTGDQIMSFDTTNKRVQLGSGIGNNRTPKTMLDLGCGSGDITTTATEAICNGFGGGGANAGMNIVSQHASLANSGYVNSAFTGATVWKGSMSLYPGGSPYAGTIAFMTNSGATGVRVFDGVARMTINQQGGVGIATTTASTTNQRLTIKALGSTTGISTLWTDSNNALKNVVLDNGNLGLGTSTPTYKLVVDGMTRSNDFIIPAGNRFYSEGAVVLQSNNASLVFRSEDNVNLMTLLAGGNLGIGTSTPAYKLDVWGDARVAGSYLYGSTTGLTIIPTTALEDGQNGGGLTLSAGDGADSVSGLGGVGGSLTLSAGDSGVNGSTQGYAGGDINLLSGDGNQDIFGLGGNITLGAAAGYTGGNIYLTAGDGSSGTGGNITITPGSSGAGNGKIIFSNFIGHGTSHVCSNNSGELYPGDADCTPI